MNYSKVFEEDTEGCSSNESGWTRYIVSPEHEKDRIDDDYFEDYSAEERVSYKKDVEEEEEGFDSDDSMASDASSGPSDQRLFHARTKDETKRSQKMQEEKKKKHDDDQQVKKLERDSKCGHKANNGGR